MMRENRARAAQLGLSEHFRFMDFATDVGPLLKGIDIMVMPSRWEASGLLAMEAMVCGTPTIGTRRIGLSETLANTPRGWLNPAQLNRLPRSSRLALQDARGAEARAFMDEAAKRFDSRNAFSQLRALYEKLAARQGV